MWDSDKYYDALIRTRFLEGDKHDTRRGSEVMLFGPVAILLRKHGEPRLIYTYEELEEVREHYKWHTEEGEATIYIREWDEDEVRVR